MLLNTNSKIEKVQCNELLKLVQKFEELFYVKLGTWKADLVYCELKEDVNPICYRPHPVPKVHKEMFNK